MKTYYVVVNEQGQYARTGSTVSQILFTEKLDEALIWKSDQFASLFAGTFGSKVRVRLVAPSDIEALVGDDQDRPTWYLGFREIGETEYRPVHLFPESDAAVEACLAHSFDCLVAAFFARQILSRNFGHSYEFGYQYSPYQYRATQRRRA